MSKTLFIKHWKLFWLPGVSLFIGTHDGNPSIWIQTRKGVRFLDYRKERSKE